VTNKVLFIGGTGIISSACSPLVIERGMELFLFNRGQSFRQPPAGAEIIQGNIRENPDELKKAVQKHKINTVVNWIAFHPNDVQRDIDLLAGKIDQYVFISSASAYQKPINKLPITEETPLDNPYWEYSRNKQACEELLLKAYREQGFPVTIVRPSHTYDKTLFPFRGGYSMIDKMRKGEPVVVHGDGTSLWVMTHHSDFAVGLVGLLGNPAAIGEVFHITSDEVLTWNAIYEQIAEEAGVSELKRVYIPSSVIAQYNADWGASLLGDKAHSVIFDNSKIRNLVPEFAPKISFRQGAKEIMAFYDAQPEQRKIDAEFNALMETMIADMGTIPIK
jgi:nucleoside-diphosphate-sugar epimerase